MPDRAGHGREPEPTEELLDCLACVDALRAGDEEMSLAAFDMLRMRLAHRADAITVPIRLATMLLDEAEKQGCDVNSVLAAVRAQALATP